MSILPPQQKSGEIKFFLAKSLPYYPRMLLVFLALACGLGLQLTTGFWAGYPLLVLGLLLGMNSGYDAAPKRTGESVWERVTPDEYEKVKRRADELKSWDDDLFDGTSHLGIIGLAVVVLGCVIAYAVAASVWRFPEGSYLYLGLDALVLIVPLWFIGTRDYLRKDKLVIKIEMLKKVMERLNDPSDAQVQPMLALQSTNTGGKEPEDARLMIKLVGAPKEFYGIQAQLSINSVQGKDFPYLYCVLIAKSGSGLLTGWEAFAAQPPSSFIDNLITSLFSKGAGGKLMYEPSSPGEVDIIVVRQQTTRNSGYFTPPAAALAVVKGAMDLSRQLLEKNSGKPA